MTEASAISLGISTKAPVQEIMPSFQEAFKSINRADSNFSISSELTEKPEQESAKPEFSSFSQLKKTNSIGDFVTDTSKMPELEEVKEEEIKTETPQYMFNDNTSEETDSIDNEEVSNEEELLEKENDEITIRSSAADRQMLLSAVLYLLSYLHIDKHPFTSLNPTLVYSLYEMLFLFVSKENTAFSNRLKNLFIITVP